MRRNLAAVLGCVRGGDYLRPHLGEHKMNRPADDVISPRLIIVPIRFPGQGSYALLYATPLRILSRAPLLGAAAQLLDGLRCDLRVGNLDAQPSHDPIVEIRDPGVVFEHRSTIVELPECYLKRETLNGMPACIYMLGIEGSLTSFRGARAFPWSGEPGAKMLQNR